MYVVDTFWQALIAYTTKSRNNFKCLFIRFGSLSHVHIGFEKWMSHVSPRKFNNVFHGSFGMNKANVHMWQRAKSNEQAFKIGN
jgi:hypothetical protein